MPPPALESPHRAASPRRSRAASATAAILVVAALGGAASLAVRSVLPRGELPALGVRLEGRPLDPASSPRGAIARLAAERLDREVALLGPDGERVLALVPRELGASMDEGRALREALEPGRTGDLARRVAESLRARGGGVDVRLRAHVPIALLAERLAEVKEERDRRPRGARRDGGDGDVVPHTEGSYVDVFATAEAIERAIERGEARAPLAHRASAPPATTEVARSLDAGVELARFETRFGGPPGRDRNIARAATALDGVILMPGEEVSFNAEVGPRSPENGFFPAPEIYRGEMREGIGGGSCQVASTVYAAMLFAGLSVIERRNHSRPSGYIRPGLDATVSYPVLDLRARNPFDFPVLLDTSIEASVLRARILGAQRPLRVELATETAGISKFKRKIERAGWLAEGTSKLKQRGKNGLRIRRTVRLSRPTGEEEVSVSMDVYPPTQEIWLLPPGADPAVALPPLEPGAPPSPGGDGPV